MLPFPILKKDRSRYRPGADRIQLRAPAFGHFPLPLLPAAADLVAWVTRMARTAPASTPIWESPVKMLFAVAPASTRERFTSLTRGEAERLQGILRSHRIKCRIMPWQPFGQYPQPLDVVVVVVGNKDGPHRPRFHPDLARAFGKPGVFRHGAAAGPGGDGAVCAGPPEP